MHCKGKKTQSAVNSEESKAVLSKMYMGLQALLLTSVALMSQLQLCVHVLLVQ